MIIWWDVEKNQALTNNSNQNDKICLLKKIHKDCVIEQILTIEDRNGNCINLYDDEIEKLRKNLF